MNLFVIPSWYPHRCHPLHGVFVLEQAIALGELHPDWNIALSVWGQGLGHLTLAHLRSSPGCALEAIRRRAAEDRSVRDNVLEFETPALTWNDKYFGGNRTAVLNANRRNFERARRRFGSIDLLHAHVSYPAGWAAMQLSAETAVPYVVTEHMGPFPLPVYETQDGSLASILREPLERAAARIAVSPVLCDRIAAFRIPRPELVPNLVDERLYHPGQGRHDPFTFFTLGDVLPVKGYPDLLRAIATLVASLPEPERDRVRFRIGGEGPSLREYRALTTELGIDRWVTWLGFLPRPRARSEFEACDAYVLASHHESFGVVLVEAMAAGKPVVATRCGGPESIVRPETGILVPVGDPAALAQAMASLLRGERTFDTRTIRTAFLEHYSRAAVVRQLDVIYDRVLGSRMETGSAGTAVRLPT